LTSGYFLTCLFLIWQIFQGKSIGLKKKRSWQVFPEIKSASIETPGRGNSWIALT
jgi:hypothetical protein